MKMPTDNAKPVAGRAQGPFATRRTGLLVCMGAAMLVASLWSESAHAQSVFRCGQSYTNAPPPGQLCELMPEQAVTRIEGTRVHLGKPPRPVPGAPAGSGGAAVVPSGAPAAAPAEPRQTSQPWRDQQARTVLETERERLRSQLQSLEQSRHVQAPLQGIRPTDGSGPSSGTAVVQAIERTRRDLQSLERELARLDSRQERR
ncbi:MAG: hypothetical protein ACKODU_11120 [Limnohabitans sp.]